MQELSQGQAERASVLDGSPKGRDAGSVHNSRSPKGHAPTTDSLSRGITRKSFGEADGNDG